MTTESRYPERKARLRCDTPDCGHVIGVECLSDKSLIDTPCAECGANLYTRQDYDYYNDFVAPTIETVEGLSADSDPINDGVCVTVFCTKGSTFIKAEKTDHTCYN